MMRCCHQPRHLLPPDAAGPGLPSTRASSRWWSPCFTLRQMSHRGGVSPVARKLDCLDQETAMGQGLQKKVPVLDYLKHYMVKSVLAHRIEVTQGCVPCGKRAGLQGTRVVLWCLDCRRGAGSLSRTTSCSTWWSPASSLERRHTRVCHHWQESWASKVPEDYCWCGDCSFRRG